MKRPCRYCAAPGVRNLGAHGYCAQHLGALYETFDPSAFCFQGRFLQSGRLRPDHGVDFADCRCLACGATAVARPGERCPWCERTVEGMQLEADVQRRRRSFRVVGRDAA